MRQCTKCKQQRPDSDYTKWSENWCRLCRNEYSRNYMKTTHRANAKRCHLMATYGLSVEQWEAMYNAQGRVCFLCRKDKPIICVDHDRETKVVRGLLCKSCNSGIGLLGDDPMTCYRSFKYLEYKLTKSPRRPRSGEDVLRPVA